MARKRHNAAARAAPEELRHAAAIRGCWGVASLICVFLAWGSLTGKHLPGCGGEADCGQVLSSKWAYILGAPVSLAGFLLYAFGFLATLAKPSAQRAAFLGAVSMTILLAIAWFVAVQALILRAFCPWCLAAHAAAGVGAVLVLRGLALRSLLRGPLLASVAAVAMFAGAQVFGRAAAPLLHSPMPAAEPVGSTNAEPAARMSRSIALHGGRFVLSLENFPVTGSPQAPHVMVSLFDYTCHVCRELHHLLDQGFSANANTLAILHLPNPLDAACNPLMKRTPDAHANACEHAKIGLAVWQADAAKFDPFTRAFFVPPQPLGVPESAQLAASLVGQEKLAEHLGNARSMEILALSSALYKANWEVFKTSKMPQVILGTNFYAGISRIEQLNTILRGAGLNPVASGRPQAKE